MPSSSSSSLLSWWTKVFASRPHTQALLLLSSAPNDSTMMTYQDLDQQSTTLAAYLTDTLGIQPQDRFGLLFDSSIDAAEIVALLAVLKCRAIYVPLSASFQDEIIADAGVRLIISTTTAATDLTAAAGAKEVPILCLGPRGELPAAAAAAKEGMTCCVPLPPPSPPHCNLDGVINILYTSGSTGPPKGVLGRESGFIYRLKWMLDAFPFAAQEEMVLRRTPLSFVDSVWEIWGALLGGASLLLPGYSMHKEPLKFWQCVFSAPPPGVTRMTMTPSLLSALLRTCQSQTHTHTHTHHQLSQSQPFLTECLRFFLVSGEALSWQLAEQFLAWAPPKAKLIHLYGSTEVSGDATFLTLASEAVGAHKEKERKEGFEEEKKKRALVPLGEPLPGTRLWVVGEDGRKVLVAGGGGVEKEEEGEGEGEGEGELWVEGEGVALGYYSSERQDRFITQSRGSSTGSPLFKTGDWVHYVRSEGGSKEGCVLTFRGRRDALVKVRGIRVGLEEAERRLAKALGFDVASAEACLGLTVVQDAGGNSSSSSGNGNTSLLLALTYEAASAPNHLLLLRHLRESGLPEEMLPSTVKVGKEGEALPMNASGKLDRQRLAHPSWGMAAALPLVSRPQREGEEEEAITNTKLEEMESWLDQHFTALLGGGQEGLGLGFFERGGHSLVAMQALSEISLHFGVVGLNVEDLALMPPQLARRIWGAILEEKAAAAAPAPAPAERPSKRTRTTITDDDDGDGGSAAVELVEQWKGSFAKCVDAQPLVVEVAPGEFWVVIGSHDQTIAAIDLETGNMKWRTRVEGRVEGAAAAQGDLVFVGCYDHRLYALELQTGSIAWSCLTGGEIKCTPLPVSLPSSSSSLVVFGSYDGHLYMCETEKKGRLWTAPIALGGSLFASPILLEGAEEGKGFKAFVLTVTNRGRVALWPLLETHEAEGGGGEERREVVEEWRYEMQCAVFITPAVVVSPEGGGQRIILGGVDGSVVALNPWERRENAAVVPLWRAVLDGPIFASPCLLPSKGQVLVACHGHGHDGQGALYCLEMETGARVWKQQGAEEEGNDDQGPASSFISGKPASLLGEEGEGRFVVVGTSEGVMKVLDVERKGQEVGGGSLRLGKNHQRLSAPVVVGVGRGGEGRHLAVFGSREDGVFCVQVNI